MLVTLVEAYEARHFPLDLPDPVESIKFVMEQRKLTIKDLVPYIGQTNRVYEVLNHKRPLTMAMAWKLHTGLGIPAESLVRQAAQRVQFNPRRRETPSPASPMPGNASVAGSGTLIASAAMVSSNTPEPDEVRDLQVRAGKSR